MTTPGVASCWRFEGHNTPCRKGSLPGQERCSVSIHSCFSLLPAHPSSSCCLAPVPNKTPACVLYRKMSEAASSRAGRRDLTGSPPSRTRLVAMSKRFRGESPSVSYQRAQWMLCLTALLAARSQSSPTGKGLFVQVVFVRVTKCLAGTCLLCRSTSGGNVASAIQVSRGVCVKPLTLWALGEWLPSPRAAPIAARPPFVDASVLWLVDAVDDLSSFVPKQALRCRKRRDLTAKCRFYPGNRVNFHEDKHSIFVILVQVQ